MNLENVQEDVSGERSAAARAGRSKAAHDEVIHYAGGVASQLPNIVVFKFGGSSLLGAARMLHAAGFVQPAARLSNVAVVVSAMKGVTDHLLSIARALASGKLAHARHEAELVLDLHLDVLFELQLSEQESLRVRHELQLLGRDLLHERSEERRVGKEWRSRW